MLIKWYPDRIVYIPNGPMDRRPRVSKPSDLVKFLWEPLEIQSGVTLRNLFEVITWNKNVNLPLWSMALSNGSIRELAGEFLKVKNNSGTEFKKIIVAYVAESSSYGGRKDFSLYLDITGQRGGRTNYAIEFSPLKTLLGARLFVKKSVFLLDWSANRKGREIPTTLLGERDPTVLEVFEAVLGELTFFGGPESRDKSRENLVRRSEEIKKAEKTGTLKTMDSKDLFKKLKEKIKKAKKKQ